MKEFFDIFYFKGSEAEVRSCDGVIGMESCCHYLGLICCLIFVVLDSVELFLTRLCENWKKQPLLIHIL